MARSGGLLSTGDNEMLPSSIPWLDKRTTKVSYVNETPEVLVKLQECFAHGFRKMTAAKIDL